MPFRRIAARGNRGRREGRVTFRRSAPLRPQARLAHSAASLFRIPGPSLGSGMPFPLRAMAIRSVQHGGVTPFAVEFRYQHLAQGKSPVEREKFESGRTNRPWLHRPQGTGSQTARRVRNKGPALFPPEMSKICFSVLPFDGRYPIVGILLFGFDTVPNCNGGVRSCIDACHPSRCSRVLPGCPGRCASGIPAPSIT